MNQDNSSNETTRTMTLLWRAPDQDSTSASPGPKPRLAVDDVVGAAVAAADANGMAGISMRAVAQRLGVTAMTLYGYVPSKEALIALMYDTVHAEMPHHERQDGAWRQQVTAWAEDLLALYVRHPWALQVSYARPVLGPHEQRVLESVAEILRRTEVDSGLLRGVIGTLFHTVRGTALTIAEAEEATDATGLAEEEWWERSSTALPEVVPDFGDRFPNTTWLLSGATGSASRDETGGYVRRQTLGNLKVGLATLLDGIEAARGVTDHGL